ncbi:DUF417 family protein [Sphingomonas suaedae]|uniref:DUF417 family protein n=1 Tax=Sphingomonas suaedae TaxID=2599297 RepID=A0A518RHK1_9SPHN|nr:DUF417 family protein [Sphingomonas suaedae]QDX26915.1 DUF417 family protein [Sphingomonas suaedae]
MADIADGSDDPLSRPAASGAANAIIAAGRIVAMTGILLPLFRIGYVKFTQYEIEGLKPLIKGTPWQSWLRGFSALPEELPVRRGRTASAFLFVASVWSPRLGVAAGARGTLTFAATTSILFAVPV